MNNGPLINYKALQANPENISFPIFWMASNSNHQLHVIYHVNVYTINIQHIKIEENSVSGCLKTQVSKGKFALKQKKSQQDLYSEYLTERLFQLV